MPLSSLNDHVQQRAYKSRPYPEDMEYWLDLYEHRSVDQEI